MRSHPNCFVVIVIVVNIVIVNIGCFVAVHNWMGYGQ